jgi:TRAP-type uncharacterized transport system substrate-binding protein
VARWRGLVCASFFFAAGICGIWLGAVALAQEPRFFRIGTAATGGSFYEIGGVVAGAISGPAGGPACGHGGSCGVPGLVAVAQATPGSIENLRLINKGQIESGFAQADLAGWAYHGTKIFAEAGAQRQLRTIASLFPEAAHLVVRDEVRSTCSPTSRENRFGRRGGLAAPPTPPSSHGSRARPEKGTAKPGRDRPPKNSRPGPSTRFSWWADTRSGDCDVAASLPVRLVPIEGDRRCAEEGFSSTTSRKSAGSYPGIDVDTLMGFSALWLVNADIDADLVYAITRSLWHRRRQTCLLPSTRSGSASGRSAHWTGFRSRCILCRAVLS